MKRKGCVVRAAASSLAVLALAGCVTLTELPRALVYEPSGIRVQSLRCADIARSNAPPNPVDAHAALDPRRVRLLTWNVHKEDDTGWQRDLAHFVADNDVVLLQEATLKTELRSIIEGAGLKWVMAVSFLYEDTDIGVLTAARVAPVATCTIRIAEPLIVIPKSATIAWFALSGQHQRLAIANIHAINFALSLGAYNEQMDAIAEALAHHTGPIVFAGDLNTWTDDRRAAVDKVARRLGLREILYTHDRRTLFFGKQLDHIYTRGIDVLASEAWPVTSSDHNPVSATLRVKP
ncbi:MAG TPA: endonuclease/exonuclease/phosphatase family protein [Casimicrobiaceae bacterium]|nr:endonuclease/exonuclease/phosphatase family protein [Casimicrobiaceae bacterium]